ncbi:J domain-containing protein [Sabulicella glaciei]|uniref:J domain-containing protein n=1 Tax=Sabulicella glaciei TaxID=2984948 RepID=A0ABT3NPP8_9PROT|nr:hypothetical protein [Roseococcus sp. MDT2-1-1]MCW8084133.1 hypothetical protein [Roseococcus sp. MDT2-1-1]
MAYLALGGLALVLTLALLHGFANAKPGQVRVALTWSLGIAGAGLLALMLMSGRGAGAFWALFLFGPAIAQAVRGWWTRRRFRRPTPGGEASGVETDTLEMRLDMETGALSGRVRQGPFGGRELGGLSLPELLMLLEHCAAVDGESVGLLEAWLDRAHPGWREETHHEEPPRSASGRMGREEALTILGLPEGATEAEIRAAHRRLMQSAHPDRGGSDWLAAQVNEARNVLLGG